MAFNINKTQLVAAAKHAEAMTSRAKKVMAKAETVVKETVGALEVGGAAFAFGMIDGRYGGVEFLHVPLPLLASATSHLMAFMGIGGQYSSHLHQLGNGALAAYLTTAGRGAGLAWRDKAMKPLTPPATAASKGDALTADERAALAGR